MTTYSIKEWRERFTVSQSSKVKGKLSWLALPINLTGSVYRELMLTPAGREAYGVFVALCCVAANCDQRGVLSDSQHAPSTLRALHHKTGVPESDLAIAIRTLVSVGWVIESGTPDLTKQNGDTGSTLVARSEHAGSTLVAIGEEIREENKRGEKKETKPNREIAAGVLVEIPESLNTDPFKAAWSDWLGYKAERREKYKSRGQKAGLSKLACMGPQRAVDALKHSMAMGWQGFFEEKTNGKANGNGSEKQWRVDKTAREFAENIQVRILNRPSQSVGVVRPPLRDIGEVHRSDPGNGRALA